MRQLYRISYPRGDSMAGITFSAADLVQALEMQEIFERLLGIEALTLKPLGQSKIVPKRFYKQVHQSALTKEEQFQQEIQL